MARATRVLVNMTSKGLSHIALCPAFLATGAGILDPRPGPKLHWISPCFNSAAGVKKQALKLNLSVRKTEDPVRILQPTVKAGRVKFFSTNAESKKKATMELLEFSVQLAYVTKLRVARISYRGLRALSTSPRFQGGRLCD